MSLKKGMVHSGPLSPLTSDLTCDTSVHQDRRWYFNYTLRWQAWFKKKEAPQTKWTTHKGKASSLTCFPVC